MPPRRGSTGPMRNEQLGRPTGNDSDRLPAHGAAAPAPASPDATDHAKRAGRKVASTGRDVASSPFMRGLARAGLLARGANYLLVGLLAVQIALGSRGTQADTTGALRAVARHPGGMWCCGCWRRALPGWPCGGSPKPYTGRPDRAARRRLSGWRRWRWACAGIYGFRRMFATYLRTARMSAGTRKVVEGLGVAGYLTRGVVFCAVGAFLIDAAVTVDPQKAQGLDGALRKTAATPLGPWLLVAVALGLVIFGLYSWCEARWRVVEPG